MHLSLTLANVLGSPHNGVDLLGFDYNLNRPAIGLLPASKRYKNARMPLNVSGLAINYQSRLQKPNGRNAIGLRCEVICVNG